MDNEIVSQEFNAQIKKIKSDKYSGSVRVLNETISALYNFLIKEKDLPEKQLIYLLQTSIKSVVETHNQFSALDHFYHQTILSMEEFISKRDNTKDVPDEKPSLGVLGDNALLIAIGVSAVMCLVLGGQFAQARDAIVGGLLLLGLTALGYMSSRGSLLSRSVACGPAKAVSCHRDPKPSAAILGSLSAR